MPKAVLFFDSCAFYPPTQEDKAATLRLKEMDARKQVRIDITHAGDTEMMRAPGDVPADTFGRLLTIEVSLNFEERKIWEGLKSILFGDKHPLTSGEKNDVTHLFEAQKYGCTYFVTCDKRHILSKAESIWREVGLRVVSPTECLKRILAENKDIV